MKQDSNYILENIYKLIDKNDFDGAYKLNTKLYNNEDNDRNKDKLTYISNLIKEKEKNYLDINTKIGLDRKKYLNIGNKLLENDKKELSFYAYTIGYRLTKHPDFLYHIALHYYNEKDYATSKKYFLKYTYCNGAKYIEEVYYYLKEIDYIFLPYQERMFDITNKAHYRKKRNTYYTEINNYQRLINRIKLLKNGIFSNEIKEVKESLCEININNDEIKNLIKTGKLNDVENIYNESDYETKITILALLYLNNHIKFADRLYKQEKECLKENCPKLAKQLNNNRQLYITKAKFNK